MDRVGVLVDPIGTAAMVQSVEAIVDIVEADFAALIGENGDATDEIA
jgi:hypothetical protein